MDYYYTIDIGVNFAGHKYNTNLVSKIMKESWASGVDKVISISNSLKEIPITPFSLKNGTLNFSQ